MQSWCFNVRKHSAIVVCTMLVGCITMPDVQLGLFTRLQNFKIENCRYVTNFRGINRGHNTIKNLRVIRSPVTLFGRKSQCFVGNINDREILIKGLLQTKNNPHHGRGRGGGGQIMRRIHDQKRRTCSKYTNC